MTDEPRLGWFTILVLMAAVFIIDLATPLGVADGMLYGFIVVFQAHFCPNDRSLAVAMVSTILIVLGFLLSSESTDSFAATVNRMLSVALVWAIAAVTKIRGVVERVDLPQLRHDLIQPLHTILGNCELLLQGGCGGEDERNRHYLRSIRSAAQELSATIEGLLRLVERRLPAFARDLMQQRPRD